MNTFVRENSFSLLTLMLAAMSTAIALQYPADSSGFPRAISIFLMVLATTDLIRNILARRKTAPVANVPGGSTATIDRRYLMASLLVFLSAPAYILLARLFDFEIASFVYLVASMWLLGMRKPILIVTVAVGVLIAVKGLFFVLLDVSRTSTLIFGT